MTTLDRTAIMVMPGQPFLDWLHWTDPTSGGLSREDLRREPMVYLLPECVNVEEARECLKEVCGRIFEEQLDGWYRVPSTWLRRRDLDAFDRWFEWSFHSVAVDLCDDPLHRGKLRPARVSPLAGVDDGLNYWTVRGCNRQDLGAGLDRDNAGDRGLER